MDVQLSSARADAGAERCPRLPSEVGVGSTTPRRVAPERPQVVVCVCVCVFVVDVYMPAFCCYSTVCGEWSRAQSAPWVQTNFTCATPDLRFLITVLLHRCRVSDATNIMQGMRR